MTNNPITRELKQREFYKRVNEIIPQMIAELEEGNTMAISRLNRKPLAGSRIIELKPRQAQAAHGGPSDLPLIESSHALKVISVLTGPPSLHVTSTALRFGATLG
jgi:hypothetical protein